MAESSWRPSLKAVSFYPAPKMIEQHPERSFAFDCNVQQEADAVGQRSVEVVKNGRVWRSKKEDSLAEALSAKLQDSEAVTRAYCKEELLLVRQHMRDANALRKPVIGMEKSVSAKEYSQTKFLAKTSTNSVCSTVDSRSDTTDDHDAVSSLTDMSLTDAAPETLGNLRANAPEFVPSDKVLAESGHTSCLSSTFGTSLQAANNQIFSSTPVSTSGLSRALETGSSQNSFLHGPAWWDCSMDCSYSGNVYHQNISHAHDGSDAVDLLEAAFDRCSEWRNYISRDLCNGETW